MASVKGGLLTNVGMLSNPVLIVLVFIIFFSHNWTVFVVAVLSLVVLTLDSYFILDRLVSR